MIQDLSHIQMHMHDTSCYVHLWKLFAHCTMCTTAAPIAPLRTPYAHQVNEGSHCADRYSTCATDSSGASCKGGVCFKNDPHDITNRLSPPLTPPLRRAAPRPPPAFSPTLPTYTPQPRCPPARHTHHRNGAPFFTTHSCKAQSDWDTCKDLHDGVKAAVSVRALPHSPARTPIQSTTLPHPLLMCARPTLGLPPWARCS